MILTLGRNLPKLAHLFRLLLLMHCELLAHDTPVTCHLVQHWTLKPSFDGKEMDVKLIFHKLD